MSDAFDESILEPDPRFPNRPESEEFKQLARLIHEMDLVLKYPERFTEFTTMNLLTATAYLADGRWDILKDAMPDVPEQALRQSFYHDAFILGRQYERNFGA